MKNQRKVENFIFYSMLKNAAFTLIVLCSISLIFIYFFSFKNMLNSMKVQSLSNAKIIELTAKNYITIARDLGTTVSLSDENISVEDKIKRLDAKCMDHSFYSSRIINLDGFSDMDTIYRGDRKYFLTASKGIPCISDTLIAQTINKLAMVAAAPVWKDGIYGSEVKSVVFFTFPYEYISNELYTFINNKVVDSYILSSDGTAIAAFDKQLVINQSNNIIKARTDPLYRQIAKIENAFIRQQSTSKLSIEKGRLYLYSAAQINGTPGWTLILKSPVRSYLKFFYIYGLIFLLTSVIVWLLIRIRVRQLSKVISIPLKNLSDRLKHAAEGDYTSEVYNSRTLDEFQSISDATQSLVNRMDAILNGSERFKESFDIQKLINFSDLNPLIQNFKDQFNCSLCIKNASGDILCGIEDYKNRIVYRDRLIINERICGFIELVPDSKASIADSEYKKLLKTFTDFVTNIATYNFQRSTQYKLWKENENSNIRHFISSTDSATENIRKWIDRLEKIDEKPSKAVLLKDLRELSDDAKKVLSDVEESFEFVKFADFNSAFTEEDYAVREIIDELKQKIDDSFDHPDAFKISFEKRITRRLFGTKELISTVLFNIISWFENKNGAKAVSIHFDTVEKNYSYDLIVTFMIAKGTLTADEVLKIKSLIAKAKNDPESETLSANENSIQNFISGFSHLASTFRIALFLNFDIIVEETDAGSIKLEVIIPQLEGN